MTPETIVANSATELYAQALSLVLQKGKETSPRGMLTREIPGVTLHLTDANNNVIINAERRLNYGFSIAEWLWIMTGSGLVDAILPFNKNLDIARDGDGQAFLGAYGPKWIEQMDYVIETLRKDPDSRQAVVNIWRDRPRQSHDTPCTLDWQFFIRDGVLNMHGRMRSNDAWLGLPYDIFNFTQIQRWIAARLGVDVGSYTHFVGSFHLYEQHFEKALAAAACITPVPEPQPCMTRWLRPSLAQLQMLLLEAAEIRVMLRDSGLPTGVVALRVASFMQAWRDRLVGRPLWEPLPVILLNDASIACQYSAAMERRYPLDVVVYSLMEGASTREGK